ncbi:centrosomal protein of 164 kDa-like isoform X3 [Hypanus sabinus]|uniref:centrosomal protein of 164 kDa-like isoform X3 n=1 Tax=Hypanus sabinus TaxID=79690 RepID=UPI0028C3E4BD|nr:centrosomal protein of 164 kDa-like isoform X3 [Hypanus sabinus]
MTATVLRIGDQLILEEDYDENYIPSEQEIQEYAREIGIDPDNEPELMWLAREGIVAPLPQEWKPCQDVTGDVYYFNFVSGQSTWDHPCDEQYRKLVSMEREKQHALGGSKKKEKRKKKEKKGKKEKDALKSAALNLPSNLVMAPQGNLAPLRGLGELSANTPFGLLDNAPVATGGLLKSSPAFGVPKASGLTETLLGAKLEEKISLNLADLSETDEDLSRDKSPSDTAQLMKNFHLDVESLGIGFEYEESAEIDVDADQDHVDEGTEPELQNLPASDEEAESQKEMLFEQSQVRSEPRNVLDSDSRDVQPPTPDKLTSDKEADDIDIDSNDEMLEVRGKSESDAGGGILMRPVQPGQLGHAVVIDEAESEEIGPGASQCYSVDGISKLSQAGDVDLKSEHRNERDPKLNSAAEQPVLEEDVDKYNGPSEKKTVMPSKNPDELCNPLQKEEQETKEQNLEEQRKRAEPSERIIYQEQEKDKELLQAQKSKEESDKLNQELEEEKNQILKEREEQLRKLRQQEEVEAQQIYRDKEEKLRLLKEKLRIEWEEEEARLKEEQGSILLKLQDQVKMEMETTEKEIGAEKEARLVQLKAELKSFLATEQQNLKAEKCAIVEQIRKEMDKTLEEEKIQLEEKKEEALSELREKLQKETEEELELLKNKHSTDLQELTKTADEKHQKALSSLQKQISDAHNQDFHKAQRKIQQIADYEQKLSNLLKEKRDEVEKEHERKLEQLKEEHQQTMDRIREEYEEKELKIKKSEEQLEMRSRELNAKCNLLQNQEMSLKLKRQQFRAEEEQLQRDQAEIVLSQPSKQEIEQAKYEHSSLQESIRLSHQQLYNLQGQQVELKEEVDALRNERQHLQNRISELKASIKMKQNTMNEELVINRDSGGSEGDELQIADLSSHRKDCPNYSTSSILIAEDKQVNMDDVRYYISAEGQSINKAKEFLVKQTHSLRKQQTALKSAKQQWRHDMRKAQEQVQDPESSQILQDVWKNLDQEARHLDEMKLTMEKGQALLQKKKEKLNQLESSFAGGLSDEDSPKVTEGKKAVTFDLTDSDDICSTVSIDLPQQKTALMTEHANMQHLSDSIQKISQDLNSVLSVLGSMGAQQSPVFSTAQDFSIPGPGCSKALSVYAPQTGGSPNNITLSSQWTWNRKTNPTFHHPTAQSLDDMLSEKWRKYFPGERQSPVGKSSSSESRLGYISASNQMKMFNQSHSKMVPKKSISFKEVIEANKRWLENYRKNPKISLTEAMKNSELMEGLIQLELDEKNQIIVHQF